MLKCITPHNAHCIISTIIHQISTIFKTIDDETSLSGQKIVSVLQARKIAQEQAIKQTNLDIQCLRNYEAACKNGTVTSEDFTRIMGKANYPAIKLSFGDIESDVEDLKAKYNDTLDRFKDEETQSIDELKTKYQEAVDKRKELYSGEHYVGNVDINNRPVVINDDGSYSTTSTSFQEKWIGDEETGSYKIIHYTPIQSMAQAIATLLDNLGNAISNFKVDISFGMANNSASLFDAIRGKGDLKFELGASGKSLSTIGKAVSSFGKSISTNISQQLVKSEDYHRGTKVGNSNYTPNSNVLKNYEKALLTW